MQAIYDALFGHVTLTALCASVVFGFIMVLVQLHKMSNEISDLRQFQRTLASKIDEIDSRTH